MYDKIKINLKRLMNHKNHPNILCYNIKKINVGPQKNVGR